MERCAGRGSRKIGLSPNKQNTSSSSDSGATATEVSCFDVEIS